MGTDKNTPAPLPIPTSELERFADGKGLDLPRAVRLMAEMSSERGAGPPRYLTREGLSAGALTIRLDFPPVIEELCKIVEGVMDGKSDEREDAIDALVVLRAFAQGNSVWAQDIPNLRTRFGVGEAES